MLQKVVIKLIILTSQFVVKYFFMIFQSLLIAGVDYTSTVVSTLTFNLTTTRQMVQVPIIPDSFIESTEQFHVILSLVNNNGISVTVDPALATVNIIDDDSKLGWEFWERERVREERDREKGTEKERWRKNDL